MSKLHLSQLRDRRPIMFFTAVVVSDRSFRLNAVAPMVRSPPCHVFYGSAGKRSLLSVERSWANGTIAAWFWKLAHKLTDMFDVLCFETLNFKGMQRLWGRKVNDLALGEFLQILEWVAQKQDKLVVYVDRGFPSSKTCSCCVHVLDELDLSVRMWRCPSCHSMNDRDDNASQNIKAAGTLAVGLGDVRQA